MPEIAFGRDTDELPPDLGERLAMRWMPRVFLHPRERFRPIWINDYVARCEPDTWEQVLRSNATHLRPDMRRLREDAEAHRMPATVHSVARRIARSHPEPRMHNFVLLYYVFLFADQPDATLCGCEPCFRFPNTGHEADVEWIALLLDPSGSRCWWTFYSAHGNAESSWDPTPVTREVARAEPPRTDSAASPRDHEWSGSGVGDYPPLAPTVIPPTVYVALGSHALFPTGGRRTRIWGFAADVCAAAGSVAPLVYRIDHLEASHPWRNWEGSMGRDGIGSLGGATRLSLPSSETNHIDTAWRRRLFRFG